MSQRRILLAMLGGSMFLATAIAADAASDAASDFEWFSQLGFPDVKACPFVRVATGRWSQTTGEPPQNNYIDGFLVATNGNTLTVFTLDLLQETFTNSAPGTAPHQRVGFELVDLRQHARTTLVTLRTTPQEAQVGSFEFDTKLTARAQAFVLAWACWRQGFGTEAQQCYDEATTMPPRQLIDQAAPVFRIALEKDLAEVMICHALDDFGHAAITRTGLLREFDSILTNFPDSEYYQRAHQTVIVLERMIAEDEQHANSGAGGIKQLSTDEKVGDLIFRLRDQHGQQMSSHRSCDIFEDWRSNNTPAHELVRMGYVAVPQLIETLDSHAFSRSTSRMMSGGVDFDSVLTIGDCAEQILERITGKSFSHAGWMAGFTSKNECAAATRRAATAWWMEVQKKGERQMLIDAIVSPGDSDAPAQAVLLRQRYPDVAASTLIRGILAATNASISAGFIRELAILDQESGTEFLKEELEHGASLASRVAAAFGLRHRAKDLAVDVMIREWRKLPNEISNRESQWELVAEFLGTCDSARGVTALADHLLRRAPEMRFKVVDTLSDRSNWCFRYTNLPPSNETVDAMEKCLVSELDDTDERFGYGGDINNTSFRAPRICDMVGWYLAKRWPRRYTFDSSASLKTRDRQRLDCMNVWRISHGLPISPIPPERATHVSPDQAAKVTLIEWSPDTIPPHEAFASRISGFKDKVLDADDLGHLFWEFRNRPESNAHGLQLKAIKDEDLSGVRLIVKLFRDASPTEIRYWKQCDKISLGGSVLDNNNVSAITQLFSQPSSFSSFRDNAKRAIASEPKVPFEISVRLEAENSP